MTTDGDDRAAQALAELVTHVNNAFDALEQGLHVAITRITRAGATAQDIARSREDLGRFVGAYQALGMSIQLIDARMQMFTQHLEDLDQRLHALEAS